MTAGLSGVDAGSWRTLQANESRARVRTGALDPQLGRPEVLTGKRTSSTFSAIGVTWKATPGAVAPVVNVRVRSGGHWTSWETLAGTDVGPDANSDEATAPGVRLGTEPLLTDPSDAYQVRVDTSPASLPRDLRVDLIDPGTSTADADLTPSAPAAVAQAQASTPTFITRAQWGADESIRGCCVKYMSTIKAGFVHHTASTNSYTASTAAAQIRAIYLYHVKSNGWSDIGYNFLVDKYGRMFEGRYGGVSKAVKGAHTGGFNQDTFAVSALGNYATAAPPTAMVESIAKIMAWKLDLYHRDPLGTARLTSEGGGTSRYAAGTTITVHTINGHRDVGYTECPGNYLYAKLGTIRSRVKTLMGPVLYAPAQNLYNIAAGNPATLVVTAHTPGPQTWRLQVSTPTLGVVRSVSGSTVSDAVSASWDLKVAGKAAPPGVYTLSLTSAAGTAVARPWSSTLTVTPPVVYDPLPPAGTPDPYWKVGYRVYGGRNWFTTCEMFGDARGYRCVAEILATRIVATSGGYQVVNAYVFNNLTYFDHVKPAWSTDPIGFTGTFTSAGRSWTTACSPNVTTGPRTCTSWIWGTVLTRSKNSAGTYVYRQYSTWVFNNRVYLLP